MVTSKKFLSSVLLAIAYASVASAFQETHIARSKHSTHGIRHVSRELKIEIFHPESTFETFDSGLEPELNLDARAPRDLNTTSLAFVQTRLNVDASTVGFRSGYSSKDEKYAYVRQYHEGIPFINAVANIAWKNDKVVAFGSSFVKPKRIADPRPTISVESIIAQAEAAFNGKYNNFPTGLEYLARPDGSAVLVHTIQIQNETTNSWYEVYADAHSGEILSATDYVAEATYHVLPINRKTLAEGQETIVDPEDAISSPFGWQTSTTTAGNNAVAFKGFEAAITPESAPGVFDYAYNTTESPEFPGNMDAARANAFYIINTVHDFTYRYGFTEDAFNFQNDNFDKGGSGNDRVLVSVQDISSVNNANFVTPQDGQSGVARMYIWTNTNPYRDGSLENDILIHEMTHGITNRMTGGGTARCLQTSEARGLGEGWSDALAEWSQHKSADLKDFVLGDYVLNDPAGIRTQPYSTNTAVNGYTYATVRTFSAVHRIGEVWANILHNVYAALVVKHGWSAEAKTNPDGTEGNVVFLHLFIDALRLQPCSPTFVTARAAWIQADANRYGGANRCLLWRTFASRGLGMNAADFVDDPTIPDNCVTSDN